MYFFKYKSYFKLIFINFRWLKFVLDIVLVLGAVSLALSEFSQIMQIRITLAALRSK